MSVQEEILRFQISVDNVLGMHVLEGQCDLSGVELGDRVRKSLDVETHHISFDARLLKEIRARR